MKNQQLQVFGGGYLGDSNEPQIDEGLEGIDPAEIEVNEKLTGKNEELNIYNTDDPDEDDILPLTGFYIEENKPSSSQNDDDDLLLPSGICSNCD